MQAKSIGMLAILCLILTTRCNSPLIAPIVDVQYEEISLSPTPLPLLEQLTEQMPQQPQTCQPDCNNRECGPDGCGSFCGHCNELNLCVQGHCKSHIALGFQSLTSTMPKPPSGVFFQTLGFPTKKNEDCIYEELDITAALDALRQNPYSIYIIHLIPSCGLDDFLWEGLSEKLIQALGQLFQALASYPGQAYLSFAPLANATWTPYSLCNIENQDGPCLAQLEDLKKAYIRFAARVRKSGLKNTLLLWSFHRELTYWRTNNPPWYRAYDFWPGDEWVDLVEFVYPEDFSLSDGNLTQQIIQHHQRYFSRMGKKLLVRVIPSCELQEEIICQALVDPLSQTSHWWGPWGGLAMEPRPGGLPGACESLDLAGAMQRLVTGGRGSVPGWFAGGFTIPMQSFDLSQADALLLHVKLESNTPLGIQLELCDINTPSCPMDKPCCPKELMVQAREISSGEISTLIFPLNEFVPVQALSAARLDTAGIREISFTIFRPQGEDGSMLIDGLTAIRIRQKDECEKKLKALFAQLLNPVFCEELEGLAGVVWEWNTLRTGARATTSKITDSFFLKNHIEGSCFHSFW